MCRNWKVGKNLKQVRNTLGCRLNWYTEGTFWLMFRQKLKHLTARRIVANFDSFSMLKSSEYVINEICSPTSYGL